MSNVANGNREKAAELRAQGLTYEQIGELLGVSRQRACQYLAGRVPTGHRAHSIYPRLQDWINENGISMAQFVKALGYVYNPKTLANVRSRLNGSNMRKSDIDKLIEVTGLPYEKLFATARTEDRL